MSRKPLIAGNWKMNLNHYEGIALVQKIAFRCSQVSGQGRCDGDSAVHRPAERPDVVDGDKLLLTYGAQDLSAHDSGAYTGRSAGARQVGLHLRRGGPPSGGRITTGRRDRRRQSRRGVPSAA